MTSSGTSASSTSGSGTTGTGSTGTGSSTTGASSSGGESSSSTTGTSSGGTTGYGGPYIGFDSGPLWEPAVDLDGGCTAAKPILDSTTSRCVQCLQDSDCPYNLVCDTTVDSCQACSSVTNSGCGPGQVCARVGVSFDLAGYSGCVPNCLDAGIGLCNPGLCLFSGLCSQSSCLVDADCAVDGGGVCDRDLGNKCVACLPDGGGCGNPGDLCNQQLGYCQQSCRQNPQICVGGTFCTPSGLCAKGCSVSSACPPTAPVCDPVFHACVQCTKPRDCPSYAPGCGFRDLCGTCQQDRDCGGLHCESGVCSCHSDSECPAEAPTCIGLDGGITGPPVCGCLSTKQCQPLTPDGGFVCEARPPYNRVVGAADGKTFGGVCIPACNRRGGGTNCGTAGISATGAPVPDSFCNYVTGYCVQCRFSSDCTGVSFQTSCLRFGDGGMNDVEFGGQPTATGGGICGCNGNVSSVTPDVATVPCLNHQTCGPVSGWAGQECQTACSVTGGPDSCTSGGYAAQATPFCDSWTGLCRGCLADYSCTGTVSSWNGGSASACELDSGSCVQCSDWSSCPGNLPGCSSAPISFGSCGFCATSSDCPAGGGYQCSTVVFSGTAPIRQCVVPCVHGDDAGLGSVSDAGSPCPPSLPYCVDDRRIPATVCGQCRLGLKDCDSGYCHGTFCHP